MTLLEVRAPDGAGSRPDEVWRGVLDGARADLDRRDGAVTAVGVGTRPGTVLLWDRETLGSPCAVLGPGPWGDQLAGLARREPHTWALLKEGTYALGGPEAYLVARMTLGTWHVTDVSHAGASGLLDPVRGTWSAQACARYGVPLDALPELVVAGEPVGRTEPRTFLGLDVPLSITPAVTDPDD